MRNIVILNSLHFSYPLPILMRVSYNTLIVTQTTADYYKYQETRSHTDGFGENNAKCLNSKEVHSFVPDPSISGF